jgi:hypothetical protein
VHAIVSDADHPKSGTVTALPREGKTRDKVESVRKAGDHFHDRPRGARKCEWREWSAQKVGREGLCWISDRKSLKQQSEIINE